MLPLPPDKRAKGRRIAEAVLGAPARARARRAADGAPAGSSAPDRSEPQRQVSAEEAAARLDAARERLRARIPAPSEDEASP